MPSISKMSEKRFYELEKDITKLGVRYNLRIENIDFSFPIDNDLEAYNSITIFIRDSEEVLEFYQAEKLRRVYRYGEFVINSFEEWERLDDYLQLPGNEYLIDFYNETLKLNRNSYDFLLKNKKNFSFEFSSWDLRLATNTIQSIKEAFTQWLKERFPKLIINFYSYPLYDLEVMFDTKSIYNHLLNEGHLFEIQEKFNELVNYSKDLKLQRYYEINFKHKEESDYHPRKYY